MKPSILIESAAALLLAAFQTVQGAPLEVIDRRDFSANSGHWHQLQQLMHNIRSRIGIPFTAMRNVGLGYHQTLEIDPLDLVLLPSGYCYSCATAPHTSPDESKRPNPFHNQMVELDETQLLVACTDPDDAQSSEWPLMKACPGQEHILKDFLIDLTSDGSRLAVPKTRLEIAPVFQVNKHTCMPKDSKQTTCSSQLLSTSASPTSPTSQTSTSETATPSELNVLDFAASIYSHKSLSTTADSPAMTSISTGHSASKEEFATSIASLPTSAEIAAPLASVILIPTNPNELTTPTPSPRESVEGETSAISTPNASYSPRPDVSTTPTSPIPAPTKQEVSRATAADPLQQVTSAIE